MKEFPGTGPFAHPGSSRGPPASRRHSSDGAAGLEHERRRVALTRSPARTPTVHSSCIDIAHRRIETRTMGDRTDRAAMVNSLASRGSERTHPAFQLVVIQI